MDQAGLRLLRATGRGQQMQMFWIYEHPIDFDGLRRFHRNFGYGLSGRLIERSPLPFGRHRWVSSLGPTTDIDVAEPPAPFGGQRLGRRTSAGARRPGTGPGLASGRAADDRRFDRDQPGGLAQSRRRRRGTAVGRRGGARNQARSRLSTATVPQAFSWCVGRSARNREERARAGPDGGDSREARPAKPPGDGRTRAHRNPPPSVRPTGTPVSSCRPSRSWSTYRDGTPARQR